MSQFTQLNLEGKSDPKSNFAAKPSPATPPTQKQPGNKRQLGSARVATIAASLAIASIVVILALAMRSGDKQKSSLQPTAPITAQVSAPVPTPASLPAKPAAKKSPRQHKLATYKNSDYGLSFRYPKHYTLKEDDEAQLEWAGLGPVEMNFIQSGGTTLTAIQLPEKSFPGTDFTAGFMTVSVNSKMNSDECGQFAFPEKSASEDADSSKIKVGGTEYSEIDDSASQSSLQTDARYFHVFENDVCYEFALGVETSSDDVKAKPVNRDAVFDKLKWMLSTVKISPVPVATPEAQQVSAGATPAPTETAVQ
ncbi:MAG TPA: hypothetical protein VGF06_17795 [Terriglobales bacterium]